MCYSSITMFVIELLFTSCIQPLRADVVADAEILVMKGLVPVCGIHGMTQSMSICIKGYGL